MNIPTITYFCRRLLASFLDCFCRYGEYVGGYIVAESWPSDTYVPFGMSTRMPTSPNLQSLYQRLTSRTTGEQSYRMINMNGDNERCLTVRPKKLGSRIVFTISLAERTFVGPAETAGNSYLYCTRECHFDVHEKTLYILTSQSTRQSGQATYLPTKQETPCRTTLLDTAFVEEVEDALLWPTADADTAW